MIRVNKDLKNIPNSLSDRATNTKRNDCIRNSRYKQNKNFNRRFKERDTKVYLKRIYNKKCAFCEQRVYECKDNKLKDDSSTIEHYRPKGIYYWLAYSWDNLLWCCYRCNQNKSNKFSIENIQVEYAESFLDDIHNSASLYNTTEEPKFIHPEFENARGLCQFDDNGVIDSNDMRVKYTITECGIDRYDLNEKRKKILDELRNKINDRINTDDPYDDIISEFIKDMKNKYSEFIAFRYWVLKNRDSLI